MPGRSKFRRESFCSCYFIVRETRSRRLAEKAFEKGPCFLPDTFGNGTETALVQSCGCPTVYQFGEDLNLFPIGGEAAFGMPGRNPQTMIDRTVKGSGVPQ